jgi:hypothetical protein
VLALPAWASADGPSRPPAAKQKQKKKLTGPVIAQQVVLPGGRTLAGRVRAAAVSVEVKDRRCSVASATPLAALVRSEPGRLGLNDFGTCSRKAGDGSGLFVRSIRGRVNRGKDGWVYKVGRKLASAGAADPSGPFGSGRLRSGDRLVWFYGVFRNGSFQRSLELQASDAGGGVVTVQVTGYDDAGEGAPVDGAKVSTDGASTTTGPDGSARLQLPAGRHVLRATKAGTIRSFDQRVIVR